MDGGKDARAWADEISGRAPEIFDAEASTSFPPSAAVKWPTHGVRRCRRRAGSRGLTSPIPLPWVLDALSRRNGRSRPAARGTRPAWSASGEPSPSQSSPPSRSGSPGAPRPRGGRASPPGDRRPAAPARSPWAIQAAARWLAEESWSKLDSAAANCSSASSSRSCSRSERPSTSWALPISSRWSTLPWSISSAWRACSSASSTLPGAQMHLGERGDDAGGVDVVADVEKDLEGLLQVGDRLLRPPELEVEGADLVQELPDVRLVAELLVDRLRLLRVRAGEHPVARCARRSGSTGSRRSPSCGGRSGLRRARGRARRPPARPPSRAGAGSSASATRRCASGGGRRGGAERSTSSSDCV